MTDAAAPELTFDLWEEALRDGSFEHVVEALERIAATLEVGGLPLAESVRCYELGVRLAQRSERILDDAELQITRLEEAATAEER